MSEQFINEPLLDMFLFETTQLIEQLEQSVLSSEQESCYFTQDTINEIFRIMHTIKGSAAMMMFENISTIAHTMEDIFYYLREENPKELDFSTLSDIVLGGVDFIKCEVDKIKSGINADGDSASLIHTLKQFLTQIKENNGSGTQKTEEEKIKTEKIEKAEIKEEKIETEMIELKDQSVLSENQIPDSAHYNTFKAIIYFEEGCEMENIRAFTVIRNLKAITDQIVYVPEDIIDNDDTIETIRREGFHIYIKSDYTYDAINELLMQTIFLKDMELKQLENEEEIKSIFEKNPDQIVQEVDGTPEIIEPLEMNPETDKDANNKATGKDTNSKDTNNQDASSRDANNKEANVKEANSKGTNSSRDAAVKDMRSTFTSQSIISVNVAKLDKLMDLVGEMVISEAMVIQNPDLQGLELDNFHKAARQLNKITTELQDIVMSIRMVPLSATFNKMHRIVRDMCKKLEKDVKLEIVGDATEVDKNIIEHISDPLMHLVRNAIDHGIESTSERLAKGKAKNGVITLEAKNSGSDVLILVKDDGKGLDRDKILKKAKENQLLIKNENDMTDREVFNLILLPGFSTKEQITEFSGRGVGMDVVAKNIEAVGGSICVDSLPDKGTQITLKIPLTLAIIDGMNVKVGNSCFTIPIISIKQSFRPKESDIFFDEDNNEMIMVRGQCYSIIRLHERYSIETKVTNLTEGIIIMVEQSEHMTCLFADELLGQQQVVVKSLPEYIQNFKTIKGLSGCTLLGDGSISLIIDVAGLISL